jgi:hypothetical protein
MGERAGCPGHRHGSVQTAVRRRRLRIDANNEVQVYILVSRRLRSSYDTVGPKKNCTPAARPNASVQPMTQTATARIVLV